MTLFRRSPKPTAAQRQERNLLRGLYWVGTFALMVCVTMTAVYGWHIGTNDFNKAVLALVAAITDIAGALLMRSSGLLFARRAFVAGVAVLILSMLCIGISGLGIFGFQVTNRVAVTKGREKIEALDFGQLEWLRGQTTKQASAKGEKQVMLGEVKQQLETMKRAPVDPPDAQAMELAKMLGWGTEEAQRWITMVLAIAVLFVQLACLWLYAFLQEQEPQPNPHSHHDPPGGVRADLRANGQKKRGNGYLNGLGILGSTREYTRQEARNDILTALASGREIQSVATLARKWNWVFDRTLRALRAWETEGILRVEKRGKFHFIMRPAAPVRLVLNGKEAKA